jgi:hypothetical protein
MSFFSLKIKKENFSLKNEFKPIDLLPKAVSSKLMEYRYFLYYSAFGLYCVCSGIGWTSVNETYLANQVISFLQVVIISLLFLKCITQNYSPVQVGIVIFLLFICMLNAIITASFIFFWIVVFIISAQGIKLGKVAKIVFLTTLICFILTVIAGSTGLISSLILKRSDGVIRTSLGFSHPNGFGISLLVISCAWVTLRYNKLCWRDWIIPLASAVAIYYISASRTTLFAILFMAVIMGFSKRVSKNIRLRKMITVISIVSLLILAILSIFLMIAYNQSNDVFYKINYLLSDRVYLANYFYQKLGVHFLGYDTDTVESFQYLGNKVAFLVDNAYCALILRYGVLFSIGFLGLLYKLFTKAYVDLPFGCLVCGLTTFLFVGFAENALFEIALNFYLISAWPLLYGGTLKQVEEMQHD